ncbi:MAG: hypothetical protein R3C11_04230 [Planctomycetaceae bacterium]
MTGSNILYRMDWNVFFTAINKEIDETHQRVLAGDYTDAWELPAFSAVEQLILSEEDLEALIKYLQFHILLSREEFSKRMGVYFARLIGPGSSISSNIYSEMRCDQRYRLLRLAIRLEHHYLKEGVYPESLQELNPPPSPEEMEDIYQEEGPFSYERTHSGYQLYSWGYQGYDDGGKSSYWNEKGDDETFRIDRGKPQPVRAERP